MDASSCQIGCECCKQPGWVPQLEAIILLCHLPLLYLALCCLVSNAKKQTRIIFLGADDVGKIHSSLRARAFGEVFLQPSRQRGS